LSTTGALVLVLLLSQGAQARSADEHCKAYTIMREAGSESKRSRRAVLDVLENRMRKMHKSCKATVSQAHQFSWYKRGIKLKVDRIRLQSYRDVATMRPVLRSCAEFFHSGEKPSWARKMKLVHKEEKLKFYC
jgi:spore germination cell wall hydrolase CwlJ-like protein